MTVLSRQSIIKYMQRKKDPIEIYTVDENRQKHSISKSQINSSTLNLTVGNKIGEIDSFKLARGLEEKGVHPLDVIDYLYYGGINPTRDRDIIEKSKRVLDLSKLDDYSVEKEAQSDRGCYSWLVKAKDGMYTFSTRITKDKEDDKKASGFILHPVSFHINQQVTDIRKALACVQDGFENVIGYFSYLQEGLKNGKKINLKKLETERKKLENISYALKDKILFQKSPLPSASFTTVWTNHYVKIPLDLTAKIETKSSLARLGLSAHHSSGKVDPGFHNQLALEFKNDGVQPITLMIEDPVAELEFHKLDKPTELGYSQRPDALYKKGTIGF